jgi:DNA-binding transcriptional MerR regulator
VSRTPTVSEARPAGEFHIGELARRTGKSVHAIRWYESLGLVPGVHRDAGNRRVYGERHVGWLELMHRLRTTGMTIAQLRQYTALARQGRTTLAAQRDLLLAHRERVQATLAEWRRALALLDRKVDFYGDWLATGRRPEPPTPVRKSPRKKP